MRSLGIIAFFIAFFTAQLSAQSVTGNKYNGWNTATSFLYEFVTDSTLYFSSYGHGGGYKDVVGKYYLMGDTLIMEGIPNYRYEYKQAFMIAQDCLIDLNSNYDYKMIASKKDLKMIKKGAAIHTSRIIEFKAGKPIIPSQAAVEGE